MMRVLSVLAIVLLLAPSAFAACGQNPEGSSFYVTQNCSFENPCVEDEPITLELKADTACYPSWRPCKAYTIDACDTIEWTFGDGTSLTTHGTATVEHTFAEPGQHSPYAKLTNDVGEALSGGTGLVVLKAPPAWVKWAEAEYVVREGDGAFVATITRSGDTTRPITLLFDTDSLGLRWDEHPENRENTIVVPAGVTSMPVTIRIPDDHTFLGDQRQLLDLFCNDGDAVLDYYAISSFAEVRIIDDEPGPTVDVAPEVHVQEGANKHAISIPLYLSQPLTEDVVIFARLYDGEAKDDEDFEGGKVLHDIDIPAGQTTGVLQVTILGDDKPEGSETFDIVLTPATVRAPVTLIHARITVTIEDDDQYALTPQETRVLAGQALPMTIISATPAASAADVELTSSDPSIATVPQRVTLVPGQSAAEFDVQTFHRGTATITAHFPDGNDGAADVDVYTEHALAFNTNRLRVQKGQKVTVHVQVDPGPGASSAVSLRSNVANIIAAPAAVDVRADGTADVQLEALNLGWTNLIATLPPELGGATAELFVEVVPKPAKRRSVR